ncbi:MAG: hypothetical protein DELT_00889 [Desulfovibrio sp.]
MHTRAITILLSCVLAFAVTGCGLFRSDTSNSARPGSEVALLTENPVSLHNYRTAREYASAGRYELAREHYLLAYAAADDVTVKDMLARELKSVDLMIRSLR